MNDPNPLYALIQSAIQRFRGGPAHPPVLPAARVTLPPNVATQVNAPIADTLATLAGGKPTAYQYKPGRTDARAGFPVGRNEIRGPQPVNAGKLVLQFYQPEIGRRDLMHEYGHLFDARKIDPNLISIIEKRWPDVAARKGVSGGNVALHPSEHFAEVFASSVNFLQDVQNPQAVGTGARGQPVRGLEDWEGRLAVVDQIYPGTREMVSYLLRQPIYGAHPLTLKRSK